MFSGVLTAFGSEAERKTVSELYEKHKNKFYHTAYSRLKNRQDAEDAIEEAFLRIAAKPEIFFSIPAHKMAAYIDVIIRNVSVDMLKKRGKSTAAATWREMPDGDIPIEEKVIGNVSKDDLAAFIMTLPEAQKQVIYLRAEFDMSNSRIAETLGISETAVRKRLSDAGKRIRKFVSGEYGNE